MLKKTITYTDYNGLKRTEDFYFNLSEAELLEMQLTTTGGLHEVLQRMVQTNDVPAIAKMTKDLVIASYGVKDLDGKRFVKNDKIREDFMQTEAFSELYVSLATDANAASEFIIGILPEKYRDAAQKATADNLLPQGN